MLSGSSEIRQATGRLEHEAQESSMSLCIGSGLEDRNEVELE